MTILKDEDEFIKINNNVELDNNVNEQSNELDNNVNEQSNELDNKLDGNCSLNNEKIKELIVKISKLNQKEKKHILNLLISKNLEFTKNANGYFFNLNSHQVSIELIDLLYENITLMEKRRNIIIDIDKTRDIMINECKKLIESNLNESIKLKIEQYNNKIKIQNNTDILINFSKITNTRTEQKEESDENEKKGYSKNSIYSKILSSLRSSIIRNKTKQEKDRNDNFDDIDNVSNYGFNDDDMADDDNDIIDNDIIDNDIINVDIDDDDIENNLENNDFIENNLENDELDDLIEINDIIDNEINIENENDITNEDEKLYYKKLLNNHGFKFDEDKHCLLVYQEYIT